MPMRQASTARREGLEPFPSKPDVGLGGVLDFMRLLWAVDHGLRTKSKQMESRLGLTGPQRLAVRIVGQFPKISAGALAEVLHLHPSTTTRILYRLEEKGLVERRSDPDDGRRVRLLLTPRGEACNLHREETVEASVTKVLSGLSTRQISSAREVLEALVKQLSDLSGGAEE
jgi:MarR family transcriptional regulator, organic hydroperoxide resistance regulator